MISKIITDIFYSFTGFWDSFLLYWWIILPIMFYILFKEFWMDFVVRDWLISRDYLMLEMIPPKEIKRGPKIMESFFQGIAGVVVTITPFDKYLKGNLTHMFSLEIIGEEGKIHFYIRVEKQYRNLIEAQLYAQYPDMIITEVEDYTKKFPKVIPNSEWDLWGADIIFTKENPYPIKTYDRFEESITGEMIDPMAAMMEVLQTLGPGQHLWLQFIVQPHLEAWNKDQMRLIEELAGRKKKKSGGFFADFSEVLSNVFKGIFQPIEFKKKEDKPEQPLEFKLTPGEKEVLKSVEENLTYNFFNTKMRMIYLGKKEGFQKSFVPTFFGTIKQFSNQSLNAFKPYDKSKTSTQYLFKESRLKFRKRQIYQRYKDRNMDGLKIALSTKELASLYHFPDMGVKTPALPRIEAKRGSAPANLPVGQL